MPQVALQALIAAQDCASSLALLSEVAVMTGDLVQSTTALTRPWLERAAERGTRFAAESVFVRADSASTPLQSTLRAGNARRRLSGRGVPEDELLKRSVLVELDRVRRCGFRC